MARSAKLHTANLQISLIGLEACSGAHFLGRALRSHEVKNRLAQVNANRMYLHVDDPPCQNLPLRSPCLRRWIKRRTISLTGYRDSYQSKCPICRH